MQDEISFVPDHCAPVPPELRGKRQALFFLLAKSRTKRTRPVESRITLDMPGHATVASAAIAPAPRRMAAILASDDFQFTF